MGFTNEVKEQALIACKRHCVMCEQFKGKQIECHHIIPRASGGEDTFDNCIPLCFDCHEEVGSYNPKHPKGNKYSTTELKERRDSFYSRVANGEFPNHGAKKVNSTNPFDKQLFDKLQMVFSNPNLQYYLVEVDLGNDFNNKVFEPLHLLLFEKENPDYEFVDEEINFIMKELFKSVNTFLNFKAIKTVPTKYGTQALISWKNENFSYEESCELARQFNDLATDAWSKYKQLNRLCKTKLY